MSLDREQLRQAVQSAGDEDYMLTDTQLDAIMQLAEEYARSVADQQLSRIYNLANDYANQDATMVGAESIRGYHYHNALETVRLELEKHGK